MDRCIHVCEVLSSWLMYLLCFTQSARNTSFGFGWWGCSSLFAAWGKSSICVAKIILKKKKNHGKKINSSTAQKKENKRKSQFQYKQKLTPWVNVCKLRAIYCMFIALLQRNVSLERWKKMEKLKKQNNNFGLLSSQVKNIKKRKWHKKWLKKGWGRWSLSVFRKSKVNFNSVKTCET